MAQREDKRPDWYGQGDSVRPHNWQDEVLNEPTQIQNMLRMSADARERQRSMERDFDLKYNRKGWFKNVVDSHEEPLLL